MNLLDRPLPQMSLRPDVSASDFFDRCEQIASRKSYRIDRRREYAGKGSDQLNLHIREEPDVLMVRMVATPEDPQRVACDVVAAWKDSSVTYDEYVRVAKSAYSPLLREYSSVHGRRLSLGIGRKSPIWNWDRSAAGYQQFHYSHQKFQEAVRALAVGAGDARRRVWAAFLILHVLRAEELPEPLQPDFAWVIKKVSCRRARWRYEGDVQATLAQMKCVTAAKIAERIVDIADALNELCRENQY